MTTSRNSVVASVNSANVNAVKAFIVDRFHISAEIAEMISNDVSVMNHVSLETLEALTSNGYNSKEIEKKWFELRGDMELKHDELVEKIDKLENEENQDVKYLNFLRWLLVYIEEHPQAEFLCKNSKRFNLPEYVKDDLSSSLENINEEEADVIIDVACAVDEIAKDWFNSNHSFRGHETPLDFGIEALDRSSHVSKFIARRSNNRSSIRESLVEILSNVIDIRVDGMALSAFLAQRLIDFQNEYLDETQQKESSVQAVLEYADKMFGYVRQFKKNKEMFMTKASAFTFLSKSGNETNAYCYQPLMRIIEGEATYDDYMLLKEYKFIFKDEYCNEDCAPMGLYAPFVFSNIIDPLGNKESIGWYRYAGDRPRIESLVDAIKTLCPF